MRSDWSLGTDIHCASARLCTTWHCPLPPLRAQARTVETASPGASVTFPTLQPRAPPSSPSKPSWRVSSSASSSRGERVPRPARRPHRLRRHSRRRDGGGRLRRPARFGGTQATILEANLAQTIGSRALARQRTIFTIPALFMWADAAVLPDRGAQHPRRGAGIAAMIPLRRLLIVTRTRSCVPRGHGLRRGAARHPGVPRPAPGSSAGCWSAPW